MILLTFLEDNDALSIFDIGASYAFDKNVKLGANYAWAKNIVSTLNYFNGKDTDSCVSGNDKVSGLWSHVEFMF